MKKKLFVIALAMMMAMSGAALAGCGEKNNNATADEAAKITATADSATSNEAATGSTTADSEKSTTADSNKDANQSKEKVSDNSSSKTDSKTDSKKSDKSSDSAGSAKGQESANKTSDSKSANSNNSSSNSGSKSSNSSNSSNGSASSSNNQSSKTYHEAVYKTVNHPAETKDVWVVDQEAYSYEEPVYDYVDKVICNGCGADITNNKIVHLESHALNDEPGGFHVESERIQVGSQTVTVPEKGHWETKVIKEAWTEKVLVKEAGWY